MTEEKQKAIEGLSPRAKRLWDSVKDPGKFFQVADTTTPKAMAELEQARLVEIRGRVARVVACWVPVGTRPFTVEEYPEI